VKRAKKKSWLKQQQMQKNSEGKRQSPFCIPRLACLWLVAPSIWYKAFVFASQLSAKYKLFKSNNT